MVELSPRDEPVWGLNDASLLDARRRRVVVDWVPSTGSSEDCEVVVGLRRGAVGRVLLLVWWMEANGRPRVSLGFGIVVSGGEGAVYIYPS